MLKLHSPLALQIIHFPLDFLSAPFPRISWDLHFLKKIVNLYALCLGLKEQRARNWVICLPTSIPEMLHSRKRIFSLLRLFSNTLWQKHCILSTWLWFLVCGNCWQCPTLGHYFLLCPPEDCSAQSFFEPACNPWHFFEQEVGQEFSWDPSPLELFCVQWSKHNEVTALCEALKDWSNACAAPTLSFINFKPFSVLPLFHAKGREHACQ